MKKISIFLSAFLLTGCTMGINHNVINIDGKQYLVETKNYALPVLPVYEWSTEPTYKEISLEKKPQVEGPKKLYEITGEISQDVKTVLQAIYNECNIGRRTSFDVKKCIERKIKEL